MSKKLSDFEKKEKDDIETDIWKKSKLLSADYWDGISGFKSNEKFGICSSCKNLDTIESKYGSIFAKCQYFETKIDSNDPVIKCTKHSEKGMMTLEMMIAMATIINSDDGYTEIKGFV